MVTSLITRDLTNNFYFEQHTSGQRNNWQTAIPLTNSLFFSSLNSRSMQLVRVIAKETSFLFSRMARRRRCKKNTRTASENRGKQTKTNRNQLGLNNYKIGCKATFPVWGAVQCSQHFGTNWCFFCCMFKNFNTGTSKNAKGIKEGKKQLTLY